MLGRFTCLYLVTRGLCPKTTVQARWTMRWKPVLSAFAVTFADGMPAAENLQQVNAGNTVHRTLPHRWVLSHALAAGSSSSGAVTVCGGIGFSG